MPRTLVKERKHAWSMVGPWMCKHISLQPKQQAIEHRLQPFCTMARQILNHSKSCDVSVAYCAAARRRRTIRVTRPSASSAHAAPATLPMDNDEEEAASGCGDLHLRPVRQLVSGVKPLPWYLLGLKAIRG